MPSNVRVEMNSAFIKLPPSVRPGLLLKVIILAPSEVKTTKPRPDCMQVLILIFNLTQFRIICEEGHLRSNWPGAYLWRMILTVVGKSTHCDLNYSLSREA